MSCPIDAFDVVCKLKTLNEFEFKINQKTNQYIKLG